MRITDIRGLHMELTEALHEFVTRKIQSLEKMCEGYSPCDISVSVGKTVNGQQKGDIWKTELRMTVPGRTFHVERITDDLYASVDLAKDELKRQIAEYKRKEKAI